MHRGSISNIGAPCIWAMRGVFFDDDGLRQDRAEWLKKASLCVRIVLILKPQEIVPAVDDTILLEYKIFRHYRDAQNALQRDPEPLFLVTEKTDELHLDTISFSETMLSRYNISFR